MFELFFLLNISHVSSISLIPYTFFLPSVFEILSLLSIYIIISLVSYTYLFAQCVWAFVCTEYIMYKCNFFHIL